MLDRAGMERVLGMVNAAVILDGVEYFAIFVCIHLAFLRLINTTITAVCTGGCGHGRCVEYNSCSCDFGWEGDNCFTRMVFL